MKIRVRIERRIREADLAGSEPAQGLDALLHRRRRQEREGSAQVRIATVRAAHGASARCLQIGHPTGVGPAGGRPGWGERHGQVHRVRGCTTPTVFAMRGLDRHRGEIQRLAGPKGVQDAREHVLALADGHGMGDTRAEQEGVLEGGLRPAHHRADSGKAVLNLAQQPERPLDIPEIERTSQDVWLQVNDVPDQAKGARVLQCRGQMKEGVVTAFFRSGGGVGEIGSRHGDILIGAPYVVVQLGKLEKKDSTFVRHARYGITPAMQNARLPTRPRWTTRA